MQGQDSDVPSHQGHLHEEDAKIPSNTAYVNQEASTPSNTIHINQDALTPGSSTQTIHQENRALSLLLSPPSSPLIPLGTIDSVPFQYSPGYPTSPQFTSTNGPYRAYDPSRGAELRSAADRANPFRDRVDQGGNVRDHHRARSRSPIQPNDLESQDLPTGPARRFNHYPREVYVPPGINDLIPQNLPSSSPTLFPGNTYSGGGGGDLALDRPGDSLGQNYPLNDGNWYGYPQEQQQQQLQGPERPPVTKQEEGLDDNYEDHLCEFAAPCRMHPSPDGMHYRKVVSHVFGRNKAVTKLFPLGVWVHYCRKHYQRARYRADQWPFTQCDLLLESLTRMENWNGVESFELILRRREQLRVGRENEGTTTSETPKQKEVIPATGQAHAQGTKSSAIVTRPGRRHPTAIIAPVPDWLRQHVGHGKTFQEIREIIELVRSHMVRLRNQERAQQQLNDVPRSPGKSGSLRRGASSSGRKGRTAKRDALPLRPSTVRFPDVEILPHFKPWVKEAALRQRSATNGPMNMNMNEPEIKNESEHRISGGGRILGEIQDNRDTNAAGSSQPSNGGFAANTAQHRESRPESVSAVDGAGVNLLQVQAHIGRAGTNRGQSESQRRRSERVYIRALDRVPGQGSNKKTTKEDEEEGEDDE